MILLDKKFIFFYTQDTRILVFLINTSKTLAMINFTELKQYITLV